MIVYYPKMIVFRQKVRKLNQFSNLHVVFPEFFWGAAFWAFKNSVKVREIAKSTFVTYFGYGIIGIYQQVRS